MTNCRKEQKYLIPLHDASMLRKKLNSLSLLNSCEYTVRSLYFDDIYNSSFYQNHESLNNKRKIRVRCYNSNYDNLFLEFKLKQANIVSKKRQSITKADFESILMDKNIEITLIYCLNFIICKELNI